MNFRRFYNTITAVSFSFILCLLFIFSSCKYTEPADEEYTEPEVKTPVIVSLDPASTLSTTMGVTLKIMGKDFNPDAKIFYNSEMSNTTYISSTELSCTLAADETTFERSSLPKTIKVAVGNPRLDGSYALSGEADFTIKKNNIFSREQQLPGQGRADNWDIVVDSNDCVFVRWGDVDGSRLIKSSDQGQTWSTVSVARQINGCYDGRMVIDQNDRFYLVWINDDGVYFSRSTNEGKKWQKPVRIKNKGIDHMDANIAVAPGGTMVLFWRVVDTPNSDEYNHLCYSYSADYGQTWSSYARFREGRSHHLHYEKIHQRFYLVYDRYNQKNAWRNYLSLSADGISWESPVVVNHTHSPMIASDQSGYLSIVCAGDTPFCFYFRSTDQGECWEGPANIASFSTKGTLCTGFVLDSLGNPHVTGMAFTGSTDTNLDAGVYYTQSGNLGEYWTAPVNVCSISGQYANPGPKIAVDSLNRVYIIWAVQDSSEHQYKQVYFARSQD